jgi:hypothetical protein
VLVQHKAGGAAEIRPKELEPETVVPFNAFARKPGTQGEREVVSYASQSVALRSHSRLIICVLLLITRRWTTPLSG